MSANTRALTWFAAHESRLIWRDFISMMTGGKPRRTIMLGVILTTILVAVHAYAVFLLRPLTESGIVLNAATLMIISGCGVMFFSLMFSQAIESVTRAYYARSDLDLILSSPAPSHRLFEIRTSLISLQTVALSVLIASPVINTLVYLDGAHWLSAYGVLIAFGGLATALSVIMTLALFHIVGASRTRLIAQIVAAIVGAGFVIALQGAAILSGQGITRLSLFRSADFIASSPGPDSVVWLPARAAMGDIRALAALLAICGIILVAVIGISARRFAEDALATAGMTEKRAAAKTFTGFTAGASLRATLRRKEWKLLKRDPWLVSQSLQQILYLIPPALLLWMNYGENHGMLMIIVPVIVMASGQLAGGLGWLAISGEDAHELIDTAPIAQRTILTAKIEAVLAIIALVLSPFAVVLALFSVSTALWLLVGGALASASAVTLQLWFRSQANRSMFRRRQVSSKVVTICEAMVSIFWAAASGLAVAGTVMAIIPAILALMVLGVARLLRP